MRLLIVSETGYSLGMASHLTKEGHLVTIITGHSKPSITAIPDIAIFDSPIHLSSAEYSRSKGVRVLGVTPWSHLLDNNPDYKTSLIKAIGYEPSNGKAGIKVIVNCWFNGQRFIAKSLVFNYDKMMPGDVGTKHICTGYIALFNIESSVLVENVLAPLEKFLRKANHRGSFSVSIIVNDGKWYVDDISADIYKPYAQAVFEVSRRSKSDILLDLFNEVSEPIKYNAGESYVCGILVSVYPYPYAKPDKLVEMVGVNPHNLKHMWKIDMGGCFGYIMARGKDHFEAMRRAYRTISKLKAEDIQYRVDIGKDVGEKIHELKAIGMI